MRHTMKSPRRSRDGAKANNSRLGSRLHAELTGTAKPTARRTKPSVKPSAISSKIQKQVVIGVLGTKHRSDRLLIDIDEPLQTLMWKGAAVNARIKIACKMAGLNFREGIRNPLVEASTNGTHLTVTLNKKLTPIETVALQAICGSDWKREAANFRRARSLGESRYWRERFNVLYDRKVQP